MWHMKQNHKSNCCVCVSLRWLDNNANRFVNCALLARHKEWISGIKIQVCHCSKISLPSSHTGWIYSFGGMVVHFHSFGFAHSFSFINNCWYFAKMLSLRIYHISAAFSYFHSRILSFSLTHSFETTNDYLLCLLELWRVPDSQTTIKVLLIWCSAWCGMCLWHTWYTESLCK